LRCGVLLTTPLNLAVYDYRGIPYGSWRHALTGIAYALLSLWAGWRLVRAGDCNRAAFACAALLALLLARFAWRRWQRWLRNRYRRDALQQLQALEQLHSNQASLLQPLARLLKSTALQLAPRREIASLSGEDWPLSLNMQTPRPVLSEQSCALLAEAQYRPCDSIEASSMEALAADVRRWIRMHREAEHA